MLIWGFDGGMAMAHGKKAPVGRKERGAVLERLCPEAREVRDHCKRAYRRSQVALDDVIDALAASLVGLIGSGRLRTLPEEPTRDPQGIRMEMVYPRT